MQKNSPMSVILLSLLILVVNGGCESMTDETLSDTDPNSDADGDTDTDSDTDNDNDNDNDSDNDNDDDSDTDDCSDASKLIYLVDLNNNFYKFDPPAKTFELVGSLNCAAFGGSPFSMSVSRDEVAYVLYSKDFTECVGIFPVSLEDASCGAQTDFECSSGDLELFGMGFATDGPDTTEETLHIGSIVGWNGGAGHLASLDTDNWGTSQLGDLTGDPEFTGNANGELWGFFPRTENPFVAQINKSNGAIMEQWTLPGLTSDVLAWAFAHWGGSYYVFYKMSGDASTSVYKVTDGVMETYMTNTGKTIVGAGVSTCAPTMPPV